MFFQFSSSGSISHLARAEPSSEENKNTTENVDPRPLAKPLTAPHLLHVRLRCAVYRLPGCSSLFSVLQGPEGEKIFSSVLPSIVTGMPLPTSFDKQEGAGFPALIFVMLWSKSHVYRSVSLPRAQW